MLDSSVSAFLERHERCLKKSLEKCEIPAVEIQEAIDYVLFPAGKRLRPLLVYLSGDLLGIKIEILDILAVAFELTHCYSLVHDDLPAMDNDDYRRGKLSCHRAYSESTAILVGDAMQALAIEILVTELPTHVEAFKTIAVTQELVKAIGPKGMVSGQSLDLTELAKTSITDKELRAIHNLKTGKLISAAIAAVLHLGFFSVQTSEALKLFAENLGLVFQMHDDYLDAYAPVNLGKNRSSDTANQKLTFASLYSKEELFELIEHHYNLALKALGPFGTKAQGLCSLIDNLRQRGL